MGQRQSAFLHGHSYFSASFSCLTRYALSSPFVRFNLPGAPNAARHLVSSSSHDQQLPRMRHRINLTIYCKHRD